MIRPILRFLADLGRALREPKRACVDCYRAGKFKHLQPLYHAFFSDGACEGCGKAIKSRDSVALG